MTTKPERNNARATRNTPNTTDRLQELSIPTRHPDETSLEILAGFNKQNEAMSYLCSCISDLRSLSKSNNLELMRIKTQNRSTEAATLAQLEERIKKLERAQA